LTGIRKKVSPTNYGRNMQPLVLWKDKIASLKRIKAIWLPKYVGGSVKLIGWPITQKEVWTKDGLAMSFLSFEDETGIYLFNNPLKPPVIVYNTTNQSHSQGMSITAMSPVSI
jgi:hypothetical protein